MRIEKILYQCLKFKYFLFEKVLSMKKAIIKEYNNLRGRQGNPHSA